MALVSTCLHVCVCLSSLHSRCVCMFALKHSLFVYFQMWQCERDASQTFVKRWREGAGVELRLVVKSSDI